MSHSAEYQFRKLYIQQYWRCLSYQYKKVALYGAGKHSQWFIEVIKDVSPGPQIICIIDDTPRYEYLEKIKIVKPDSTEADSVEAIIISSDSNEGLLKQKALEWSSYPVLTLYEDAPEGPYLCEEQTSSDPVTVDEVEVVFNFLKAEVERPVMIDVGAHYGESLKKFAVDGWQVHAFEPDPENLHILQENVKKLANVVVDARAVSETTEQSLQLYNSSESSGISSLVAFHESHESCAEVNSVCLSDYCRDKDIDIIDFLKIDTEGYDLFVLKGLDWLKPPGIIVCEFEDAKTKHLSYDFHDLAGFLRQQGYHLIISEWYPIESYGKEHKWNCFKSYPCELDDKKAWGNIIAVQNETDFQYFKELHK